MAPLAGLLTPKPVTIASHPALPMQEAMLLRTIASPEKADYLQQLRWRWTGPFRAEIFGRSWAILAERHEVLRSRFVAGPEGRMMMETLPEAEIPIKASRLQPRREADREHILDEERRRDRALGMRIDTAPLMRFRIVSLESGQTEILWTSHHALFDGRGRLILLREFQEIYRALLEDREAVLRPAPRYSDYLTWNAGNDFGASLPFWRKFGAGAEPTPLDLAPSRRPDVDQQDRRRLSLTLEETTAKALRQWTVRHEISLNTLTQAAWALTLARTTGQTSVCFGAPRAGRHPPIDRADSMVGVFVNTVPLHIRVDDDRPKLDWLRSLRTDWFAMRPYEQTPLRLIQRAWNWPEKAALFDTLVGYERYQLSEQLGAPLPDIRWTFTLEATTDIPLTVQVYDGSWIRIEMTWDPARFGETALKRLADRMTQALGQLASEADATVGSLGILGQREEATLRNWSCQKSPYPSEQTVHSLFSRQARERPDSVALRSGEISLTYGELEAVSNQLAHRLVDSGVKVGDRVGLLTERSIDQIVAILAILKAGAAYLPLDPEYPDERLRLLLKTSGTRIILHDAAHSDRLREKPFVHLSADRHGPGARRTQEPPKIPVKPDDLAYVMFTSGSTGEPKGVEVPHRAVLRLLFGIDYVDLGPENRLLYLAPAAFDASTFEIWGALLHGGRLIVFPDRVPTIQKLDEVLRREQIDTLWLTCSLFNFIIDEAPGILKPIRQLLTGGEALSPVHIARAQAALPETQLINGYGPTETTTFACCHRIPKGIDPEGGPIPIGRPIGNTNCHVLDPKLRLVPIGTVGELFIGGAGVARGYLNQPALTAERFLPSPFQVGDRLYRTGDLVRWREDGLLEYLGRIDHQVKIRGHRIEPGEIENALCRHPAIRQAAVLVETDSLNGKFLSAWVAAPEDDRPASQDLTRFLEQNLPAYLIPARIQVVRELPRNVNGKIDRRALARMSSGESVAADKAPIEAQDLPVSEEEASATRLFAEILNRPVVRPEDSFFCVGGDSLQASRLIYRLSRQTGIEFTLTDLHTAPTPRGLARLAQKRRGKSAKSVSSRMIRLSKRNQTKAAGNLSWYFKNFRPGSRRKGGNISRAFRIRGPFNQRALRHAIDLFVSRHEAMRTRTWMDADGEVRVTVEPSARVVIQRQDLSGLPPHQRLGRAKAVFREDARKRINLSRVSTPRVKVTRFGSDDHFVTFIFPHAHFDAVSLALFYEEVSAFYEILDRGEAPDWPMPKYQPIDYVAWERRQLTPAMKQSMEPFWRETISDPPLGAWFPTDGPVTESDDGTDRTLHFLLPPDLASGVRALSRRFGTTVFMTLMASNAVLVNRHTGQTDFLIGSVVDGRAHPAAARMVGHLGRMLYFRARPDPSRTFTTFLESSTREWIETIQHRTFPVGEIVNEFLKANGREGGKLTPFFIVHGADDPAGLHLAGTRIDPVHRHFGAGPNLPKIEIRDTVEGISLLISYRTRTFRKSTILRYVRRYEEIIRLLVEAPGKPMALLPDYRESTVRAPSPPSTNAALTTILRIMADTLGCQTLPADRSFYELGGDSLSAMRFLHRLYSSTGLTVPIDQFNTDPTAAGISRLVDDVPEDITNRNGESLETVESLSPKHAWLFRRLQTQGKDELRFICRVFELTGRLDLLCLRRAINLLIARHDSLRMGFARMPDERITYRIDPPYELELPLIDLSTSTLVDRDRHASRIIEEEMREPIDHWKPRPLRVRVICLENERFILLISVIHTAADGRSVQVIYEELSEAYNAFREGRKPGLAPPLFQFTSVHRWNEIERGKGAEAARAYWTGLLAPPLPPVHFAPETGHPFTAPEMARRTRGRLPTALDVLVRRFAREQGTTYFSILLAGFVAFLGRSARSDDVAVSTGFHGRFHPGTKDTIGDFSNNIVVRGRLTEQSTFRKLSRDIGHQIQEGIRHDHLHQSHFASIANFEQSTAKVPFLPVKFSEGPENAESIDLDGLQVNSRPRTADTTYLLTDVIVRSFGNQTRLEIATPVRLYSEAWVKRMIDGYLQFLRGAVSAPDDPIRQMPNWRIAAQGRRRTKRRLTRSIPG